MTKLDYIERYLKAVQAFEQHLEQVLALGLKELPSNMTNYANEPYDKMQVYLESIYFYLLKEKTDGLSQEWLDKWEKEHVPEQEC